MKAVLEFNLDDECDSERFSRCVNADKMTFALFEITHNLRKSIEWELSEKEGVDEVDFVFDKIFDILRNYGINSDDL